MRWVVRSGEETREVEGNMVVAERKKVNSVLNP